MTTYQERDLFRSKILDVIGQNHDQIPDQKLTGFLPMIGRNYSGELMVVGRAVNGWDVGFMPADIATASDAYAETVYKSVVKDGGCPMDWVSACWGATEGYNTKKSAFWRTIKSVTEQLRIAADDDDAWPSKLAWSNLYKVAPADGGNPGAALSRLQLQGCIDLMRLEIETHKPNRLVFLTGLDWAFPFIDALGFSSQKISGQSYVQSFGKAKFENGHQLRFVVAAHPQGKSEFTWVAEVVQALETQ